MDYIAALQNFGVAFVCLVALAIAIYRGIIWFALNVAKPVADRHIKFIDDLTTAMASIGQSMQTMAIQQGKNLDGIQKIMEKLQDCIETQQRRQEALDRKDGGSHEKPQC